MSVGLLWLEFSFLSPASTCISLSMSSALTQRTAGRCRIFSCSARHSFYSPFLERCCLHCLFPTSSSPSFKECVTCQLLCSDVLAPGQEAFWTPHRTSFGPSLEYLVACYDLFFLPVDFYPASGVSHPGIFRTERNVKELYGNSIVIYRRSRKSKGVYEIRAENKPTEKGF